MCDCDIPSRRLTVPVTSAVNWLRPWIWTHKGTNTNQIMGKTSHRTMRVLHVVILIPGYSRLEEEETMVNEMLNWLMSWICTLKKSKHWEIASNPKIYLEIFSEQYHHLVETGQKKKKKKNKIRRKTKTGKDLNTCVKHGWIHVRAEKLWLPWIQKLELLAKKFKWCRILI